MKRINLNELAKDVTDCEGKAESLSIAQVKEVIRITLIALRGECDAGNASGVMDAIERAK